MRTATIKDVALVSVGTWAAATGVTTVTRSDLESMLAAHADQLVDHAPVKLGHASALNDAIGDGNPAYGWVVPTRIGTNAAGKVTLFGDLVGMPAQLADVAPTAYRRRSVEIAWDVKTPAGKTYRAALVGIALLGAQAPAVKGLDDVLALYSAQPVEERRESLEVVEGLEDQPAAVRVLAHLRAAGATTEELTDLAAAAGARDTADVPPPVEDAGEHGTQNTATQTTQEGRTMTVTDEQLRKMLGLEADADVDAAVAAAIAEREAQAGTATGAPAAPATATTGTPAAPAAPAAPATGTQPEATATGTQTPELVGAGAGGGDGTVQLSAGSWAEAQRDIEWARNERRRQVLDGAVREGRISPAERGKLTSELAAGETVSGFAAQLERDEQGTTTLLSGLTPRFTVTELGQDHAPNAEAGDKAFDEWESQVFGVDRSTPQA